MSAVRRKLAPPPYGALRLPGDGPGAHVGVDVIVNAIPKRTRLGAAGAALGILAAAASTALAFDPGTEQRNFAKTHERSQHEFGKPDFQAALAQRFTNNIAEETAI